MLMACSNSELNFLFLLLVYQSKLSIFKTRWVSKRFGTLDHANMAKDLDNGKLTFFFTFFTSISFRMNVKLTKYSQHYSSPLARESFQFLKKEFNRFDFLIQLLDYKKKRCYLYFSNMLHFTRNIFPKMIYL